MTICRVSSSLISFTLKLKKKINAEVAQLVEHNLAKVRVAGPSPVFRSQKEFDVGQTLFYFADNISSPAKHGSPAKSGGLRKKFS